MLHLIAIFSLIRQAWTYDWPTPTLPASNGFSFDGWSPKPTSQVGLVEKRQDTPSTICGYVGGIATLPLDCGAGHPCGYNTDYFYFGCCASTTVVGGTPYPAGCDPPVTECVPYVSLDFCTGDCATDPLVLQCTDTNSPYCGVGTMVDPILDGFATVICATTPFTVPVYLTPTDEGAASSAVPTGVVTTEGGNSATGRIPTGVISSSLIVTSSGQPNGAGGASQFSLPAQQTTTTTPQTTHTTQTTQATQTTQQTQHQTAVSTVSTAQAVPTNFPLGLVVAGWAMAILNPL